MKKILRLLTCISLLVFVVTETSANPETKDRSQKSTQHVIWSAEPLVMMKNPPRPRKYFQHMWGGGVYPVGNGRLGCTIYGGINQETIQFNEDTLWTGDEDDTGRYQNFGHMFIALDGHEQTNAAAVKYRRELDIEKALHTITYEIDGVKYRREYFAGNPDNVMVYRFSADRKGAYTGTLRLEDAHPGGQFSTEGSKITFSGAIRPQKMKLKYEAQAMLLNDGGSISASSSNSISFKDCDSLLILLDAGTDYLNRRDRGWKQEHPHERITARLAAASEKSFDDMLAGHIKDYQSLFNRLSIDLGETPDETRKLETADRLKVYREKTNDPDLEETLYQYARYLMISSSRPGNMPANLQGLWNPYNWPPWRSDYHTDVNVQMNYWFVDQANLSECFLPLAEWVHSIREVRRETTEKEFGVRGWATRSENGIFGGATYHWVPGDASWVAQNLWDHYAFTLDEDYLRDRAYPVMKELCEYWEDSMKEMTFPAEDGGEIKKLVSPASISPEHGPKAEGNSYEQQLSWDLFSNYIEGTIALDKDSRYREKVADMKSRLLGPQIGKWGQLQEWAEDRDNPKDRHRHLSHMIAVHPGRQISPLTTPELAEAAKVSMNARGDGATGWSKVWKICIWARLHDGDRAYKLLSEFIKKNVYPNLWGYHPPFQIDGNFGYAAGVNEMLVQSHLQIAGEKETTLGTDNTGSKQRLIDLLPALPAAWPKGNVKGMKVRGGFETDIYWQDGKLSEVALRNISNPNGKCTVRYGKTIKTVKIPIGKEKKFSDREF